MGTFKKLNLLIWAVFLCMACRPKGPERYTIASVEIDVVKALVKDYNDGNWDGWASHYADTVKIYHNTLEASGAEGVLKELKTYLAATSSYGFTDKDMFYEMVIDDKNEIWVNFWATWEGILAENNKKLVIPVHLTAQFIDGKIVEEHAYYNMSEFVLAMQEIEAAKMKAEVDSEED